MRGKAGGRQDEVDCAAIKRFQTTFQLANPVGYADPATTDVAKRLADRGVAMSGPAKPATITFGVNETWNRLPAAELIDAFEKSLN